MGAILKRKVVIGAVGAAVMVGAGGTYAASQRSGENERQAFLNDAAKRLNVSPKELTDALEGAFSARLDAAVADGRLTKAQADEIKERMKAKGGLPFFGPRPGFHHGIKFGGLNAAAKYLGLSEEALFRQLAQGKSLAKVAEDRNKSVDGLKQAIEDGMRDQVAKAVKEKHLTQKQADEMLKALDSRIDDIVNRSGHGPRFERRFKDGPHFGERRKGGRHFEFPPCRAGPVLRRRLEREVVSARLVRDFEVYGPQNPSQVAAGAARPLRSW